MGGVMSVEKSGDAFTSGTFALETNTADALKGLNVAKKMLDFGPLATDGAFRLLHGDRRAWQLIPLPGSNPSTRHQPRRPRRGTREGQGGRKGRSLPRRCRRTLMDAGTARR
jgi:hypothetical protein